MTEWAEGEVVFEKVSEPLHVAVTLGVCVPAVENWFEQVAECDPWGRMETHG